MKKYIYFLAIVIMILVIVTGGLAYKDHSVSMAVIALCCACFSSLLIKANQ